MIVGHTVYPIGQAYVRKVTEVTPPLDYAKSVWDGGDLPISPLSPARDPPAPPSYSSGTLITRKCRTPLLPPPLTALRCSLTRTSTCSTRAATIACTRRWGCTRARAKAK